MGRSASVSFSFNESNQREKIKFVLNDAYSLAGSYRPMLLAALSGVDLALQSSIVIDKGHKSKSLQRTVIEFWAQQTCHQHGVDAQSVLTDLTGDKPSTPNLNPSAAAFYNQMQYQPGRSWLDITTFGPPTTPPRGGTAGGTTPKHIDTHGLPIMAWSRACGQSAFHSTA